MKNAKTSHPILDYLLVLCSLFCFGFKIFQYNSRAAFAILAIACLAALLTRGARAGLKPGRILLLLPVAALLLARLVLFSDHLFITFTLNVILAAMICARVGRDYYRYYYRWLVFFSATSLFFFLLQNIELTSWIQRDLVPLFAVEEPETHREMAYNIFIHNFSVSKTAQGLDLYRNNGPFWEPGLFGGFLAIALHVSLFIYKKKILTLPNLLLLAAILTTFSTGAYILLAIILASFYLKKILARPRYIVIATLLAIALLAAYSNLEFMQVKIQEQELHARQMSINEMKSARDMPRLAFFAMHLSLVSSTFSNTLLGVDFSWMEHAVATPYVVCGISAVFLYFGFFVGAYYLLLIIVAAARAPRGSPGPHAWVDSMAFILLLLVFAYTQAVTVRLSYIIFIVIGLATRNAAGRFPLNTGGAPVHTGDSPVCTGESPARTGGPPARTGESPGRTGEAPVHTGESPARTGASPVCTGASPGRAGEAPPRAGERE